MNVEIICNELGTGKTTYVTNHFFPFKYFTKDILEITNWNIFRKSKETSPYCIIDSVDNIPKQLFDNCMSELITLNWKTIIFVFDITKEQLTVCQNFNMIWNCGFIPLDYEYSNFVADKSCFYQYLSNTYPEINASSYDNIIEITNHNFKKIDRLMLHNHLNVGNRDTIDNKALAQYIDEIIQSKYKDIPNADIFLKKASIIGEQFVCDVLEATNGFGYDAASAYLKQMNEMHGFIRNCINIENQYEFVSSEVYQSIFNSISSENKISWIKILIQYYECQYEHCIHKNINMPILTKLKELYQLLPSYKIKYKKVCFLLFYKYRRINNTYKALELAKEIVETLTAEINLVEYAFIQNYRVKTTMQNGDYQKALKILQDIHDSEKYPGSRMLIKYYYSYCLYQTGNIDLSYYTTLEIIEYLKNTSGSNTHSQNLFCMTYSLMSTIQNHLGLDDGGARYFVLALNNALSKLDDKKYFYDILKKCDMFYDYEQIQESLEKCLEFYAHNCDWSSAGEVCTNLATEMMFHNCADAKKSKKYFDNAINYFSEYHNEKLAYAKNNLGIYYIIVENNIVEGLNAFKEALVIGLSDFSYMTIYLNICMCYILLGRIDSDDFTDAQTHFIFAKKKLGKRKHKSIYEDIYEKLLYTIIDEHQGKDVTLVCESMLTTLDENNFFTPLLIDIIKRNQHKTNSFSQNNLNNSFYYNKMNQLRCFLAEFRFWE